MADSNENSAEEDNRLLEDTTTAHVESRTSEKSSVYQRNVVLCVIVFFFAELFELGLFAPTTALLERSICRAHYKSANPAVIGENGWVATRLCKEQPIQAELARIKGWKAVFDCIPGSRARAVSKIRLTSYSVLGGCSSSQICRKCRANKSPCHVFRWTWNANGMDSLYL